MRRAAGPLGVALVTAVCAVALMWQPGGGEEADLARGAVGFTRVSLSTCTDWRSAGLADRQRVVSELGDHFGHRSAIWAGAKLSGADARDLLESTCSQGYARNIRLYKIYARGLAFRSLRDRG